MHSQSSTKQGPEPILLPFGGLGLDLAEVRRKVSGLVLMPFPQREEPECEPAYDAPPPVHGAELLVMLSRQTLGS